MKFRFMVFFVLAVFFLPSFAQRVSLMNGETLCRVSSGGVVTDESGGICCKFARNGVIFDEYGHVIGKISNGKVTKEDGRIALYFSSSCVYNAYHMRIGTISNGKIYDSSRRMIGRYSNVRQVYIAVIFFSGFMDLTP